MVKDLVDIVDNMVNMTKAYSTKNVICTPFTGQPVKGVFS